MFVRENKALGILAVGAMAAAVMAGQPGVAVAAQASKPVVGPNVPVTAIDLIAKISNNSPGVAIDPTDRRFVAMANRIDGPDFSCALQVSGDAGRSWVTPVVIAKMPAEAEKCYAPEVAFDSKGTLYYMFVGLAGGGNAPIGAFITTSSDRARNWSVPRKILGPERYSLRMALDPSIGEKGRIHLAWLEARSTPLSGGMGVPPNPIMAAYSDDGGKTFSEPVQVSDPARERVVAPALALGPDHAVHVLYYDLEEDARDYHGLEGPVWDGKWSLVMASSRDDGRSFGAGTVVDKDIVPPERVMLIFTMPPASLVADRKGHVYVGWHDARHGDWDVFVRASADAGRTWAKPMRVNDDPVGGKRHQYLPRLSVARNGRLDTIFYDRRGNVENRGNDVYFSYSTDHGKSFARNTKLTSWDSDSKIGYQYAAASAEGLYEFGSRLGLVSEPSRALAAWTDTRNTARSLMAQDIFVSAIVFPSEPGLPWWVLPGGVVLTLATVAFLISLRRGGNQVAGGNASEPEAPLEGGDEPSPPAPASNTLPAQI